MNPSFHNHGPSESHDAGHWLAELWEDTMASPVERVLDWLKGWLDGSSHNRRTATARANEAPAAPETPTVDHFAAIARRSEQVKNLRLSPQRFDQLAPLPPGDDEAPIGTPAPPRR